MNIEDRTNLKLKKIIDKEPLMLFPEFLRALRVAYGLSRRNVCIDLNFSEMRMFCLEHGRFKKHIPPEELEMISKYYNIDIRLMKRKADYFIAEGFGRSQTDKPRTL